MQLMNGVRENRMIETLTRSFARSPVQINGRHEADAELIPIPGSDLLLALTADAVVEEIESGLYDDLFLVGWMGVTAALSDLAAVGADPMGVLIAESVPTGCDVNRLQEGIGAACDAHDVHILGGDTNASSILQLTATAAGTVPAAAAMTRIGAVPGDAVCTTGPLGGGSAYAIQKLLDTGQTFTFRPRARLEAGRRIRGGAACCIDTSDGALAALDQLMRLNGAGFRLDGQAAWLHPAARQLSDGLGIDPWIMLAGLHGEFELLFCMTEADFHRCSEEGWMRIGTVIQESRIEIASPEGTLEIDSGAVRDLFDSYIPDISELIQQIHACTRIIC